MLLNSVITDSLVASYSLTTLLFEKVDLDGTWYRGSKTISKCLKPGLSIAVDGTLSLLKKCVMASMISLWHQSPVVNDVAFKNKFSIVAKECWHLGDSVLSSETEKLRLFSWIYSGILNWVFVLQMSCEVQCVAPFVFYSFYTNLTDSTVSNFLFICKEFPHITLSSHLNFYSEAE